MATHQVRRTRRPRHVTIDKNFDKIENSSKSQTTFENYIKFLVEEMDTVQTSSSENNVKQVLKLNKYKPTHFRNIFQPDRILEGLQSLRKNEDLCDIRFEMDDGLFTFGHKNVLIAASPYFRGKFESQNIFKTGNNSVTISELKSTVLQILINYIYTGEIEVTKENVEDLLPAAKLVQLDFVYVTCIEFLQKKMDGSNCLSIRTIANNFNYPELLAISETFMKKQFLEVVKTEDFLLLSYDDVVGIIACNGLAVPCEEQSVEVYRPSDGVWSSVADMEISRFRPGNYNAYIFYDNLCKNGLNLNYIFI